MTSPSKTHSFGLNWEFCVLTWSVAAKSEILRSLWFWGALGALVLLSGANSVISKFLGDYIGDYFTVVTTTSVVRSSVIVAICKIFIMYCVTALLQTLTKFTTSSLAVHVRRNVGRKIYASYFGDNKFHELIQEEDLAATDQQLVQDIEGFSFHFAAVLSGFMVVPIQVIYFWIQVSLSMNWTVPFLVPIYYGFFALIQKFVMSKIVDGTYSQERYEGNFRQIFSRLVQCSETIAIYGGGSVEEKAAGDAFHSVLENKEKIIRWECLLNLISYFSSYNASVMGYLIVAWPLLLTQLGEGLSVGYVSSATYQFGMLVWGFTQVGLLTISISTFAGFACRVGILVESLNSIDQRNLAVSKVELCHESTLSVRNVSVEKMGNVFLEGITLDFTQNTLVVGPTGCGKTSLVRVLAGLWCFGEPKSRFLRESLSDDFGCRKHNLTVLFIPQDTYMTIGNLKQQLCYPVMEEHCDDLNEERIREILSQVGLDDLLSQEDIFNSTNWVGLSSGQKQKIAMARVIYHCPKIVVLDEISSDVDLESEERFYLRCKELDIIVVSVGHRPSLMKYHTAVYEVYLKRLVPRSNYETIRMEIFEEL